MRVLVTGSRDWADRKRLRSQLFDAWLQSPESFVLVHGACPTGADAMADEWAVEMAEHGVIPERHPADWSQGRGAGPKRNAAMVAKGADLCLAFIGDCTSPRCGKLGAHRSHGAAGCADLAENAGIDTRRHYA